jgi:5-methylcytosine-specific restriction endonuclease McrA
MTERRWTLPEPRERLTRKQFVALFMRQDGRCGNCTQKLEVKGGQVVCVDEHLNPLWRGGSNEMVNRELWCAPCTKPKTAQEAAQRGKAERVRDKHIGALKSGTPMKAGRTSPYKRKMNGQLVWRDSGEPVR